MPQASFGRICLSMVLPVFQLRSPSLAFVVVANVWAIIPALLIL